MIKTRVNISIDPILYQEQKKYIGNLSRFLEACIRNYVEYQKINTLHNEHLDNDVSSKEDVDELLKLIEGL